MKEAAEAFLETINTLGENIRASEEAANWINGELSLHTFSWYVVWNTLSEFSRRCVASFESMGDAATHLQAHDEAIEQYSVALSLNPTTAHGLYLKRSKARAIKGFWEDAISDANEVWLFFHLETIYCWCRARKAIILDPACPWGYERKHAALHGAQRFDEAVDVFVSMLSAIENSPDQGTRRKHVPQPAR
jgi:tetratricopeptide (TPR) repeat protein